MHSQAAACASQGPRGGNGTAQPHCAVISARAFKGSAVIGRLALPHGGVQGVGDLARVVKVIAAAKAYPKAAVMATAPHQEAVRPSEHSVGAATDSVGRERLTINPAMYLLADLIYPRGIWDEPFVATVIEEAAAATAAAGQAAFSQAPQETGRYWALSRDG